MPQLLLMLQHSVSSTLYRTEIEWGLVGRLPDAEVS